MTSRTHTPHTGARAILAAVAALLVGAAVAGWGASLLHAATDGTVAKLPEDDRLPMIVVALGALVACAGLILALGYYTGARIAIRAVEHRHQAVLIGALWGSAAVIVAGFAERATAHLPGAWGSGPLNNIFTGPIEEGVKLLLPVLLLLFVARFRDPKLGFWLVVATGSAFGIIEGLGYVLGDVLAFLKSGDGVGDHVIAAVVGTLNRAGIELLHPLLTAGAAGIIWLAAANRPRGQAVLIGIAGYLGAAALHSFNDVVLGGYLREANVLLAITVAYVFVVAVYALWYRPQFARLNAHDRRAR